MTITVRLLTDRAGTNWTQSDGDIVELDSDEAARLIRAGQAEAVNVEDDSPTEPKRPRRR